MDEVGLDAVERSVADQERVLLVLGVVVRGAGRRAAVGSADASAVAVAVAVAAAAW